MDTPRPFSASSNDMGMCDVMISAAADASTLYSPSCTYAISVFVYYVFMAAVAAGRPTRKTLPPVDVDPNPRPQIQIVGNI
eukprot:scaffold9128_cov158-Skeletonema_marinoi.AAC.2